MRIISFTEKWDKLKQPECTTFRFPRKDKDWYVGEIVQVFYKNRSPKREKLGIAGIRDKEPKVMNDVTEQEAKADGFYDHYEMWKFLKCPDMDTVVINKLTLKWTNPVG